MIENQDIEFKKVWKDDWLEWICGFANTTGGLMYIGADDNGNIVGLGNKAGDY
jgi:ATP-dependent DNA helicase RecG